MAALLEIRDLNVTFHTFDGAARALRHIDLDIMASESMGLVGETGSGKTILSLSIMRLVPAPGVLTADAIRWKGKNLPSLTEKEMNGIRGREISMIPQSPMTALNPIIKVRRQMEDVIRRHHRTGRRASIDRARELLSLVGLPDPDVVLEKYPYELSGGMCQRVAIAMAISSQPALLIADEPTTALDVTVQEQIIRLVRHLRSHLGSSLLWISHDLGVIRKTCERTAILYAGAMMETGPTEKVLSHPLHPYTKALISAIPSRRKRGAPLREIRGQIPGLLEVPEGCVFSSRCEECMDVCTSRIPPLRNVAEGRSVACHLFGGRNHG